MPGGTFEDEGPWEHDKTKTVVHVTTQFSDMHEFTKLKYYKDRVWKSRSECLEATMIGKARHGS